MSQEFLDYLEDIVDAMDKAEILVSDVDFERFETDFRINVAVIRALEIIGEATKLLPAALRDRYPHVPWKEMAGMRDRLIHGYGDINLRIVWDTVTQRIPIVRPQLWQILADYEEQE